jgi:hypothetical protein
MELSVVRDSRSDSRANDEDGGTAGRRDGGTAGRRRQVQVSEA